MSAGKIVQTRRGLALLVGLVLGCLWLSGCGSREKPKDDNGQGESQTDSTRGAPAGENSPGDAADMPPLVNVVEIEGDFNMTMPTTTTEADTSDLGPFLPLKLTMKADGEGHLAGMRLNEQAFGPEDWDALQRHVIGIMAKRKTKGFPAAPEIEIDCDYGLSYAYVIEAITAVSGYQDADGKVVKLIDTIKFSPAGKAPQPPPDEQPGEPDDHGDNDDEDPTEVRDSGR